MSERLVEAFGRLTWENLLTCWFEAHPADLDRLRAAGLSDQEISDIAKGAAWMRDKTTRDERRLRERIERLERELKP